MIEKDKKIIKEIIECEGFETAIKYVEFEDVEDEKFHELRNKYLITLQEWKNYLHENNLYV